MVSSSDSVVGSFKGYDIIGDVHGCYHQLVELLSLMGYRRRAGVYRHPNRQAVFVGDLVDRGPAIRETLELVRTMVEAGAAQVVLGNHEISLLAYLTPKADSRGDYVRPHTERHLNQVEATLEQFADSSAELEDYCHWFYRLPLFLEFDYFRVVHACWDQQVIDALSGDEEGAFLSLTRMQHWGEPGSTVRQGIDRLTRGTDMPLPGNMHLVGSDGNARRFFRTKFWLENPRTYNDVLFQPDALPAGIAPLPISDADRKRLAFYGPEQKPLFVGHYWRSGQLQPLADHIACLDYCAVTGGRLVAYRLDRCGPLSADHFVSVQGLTQ